MITEDPISDQNGEKPLEKVSHNPAENTQSAAEAAFDGQGAYTTGNEPTETDTQDDGNTGSETLESPENNSVEVHDTATEEQLPTEDFAETDQHEDAPEHEDDASDKIATFTLPELLNEMEDISRKDDAGSFQKRFSQLREQAGKLIHADTEEHKNKFLAEGNAAEDFSYQHPEQARFSTTSNLFREKNEAYTKKQEEIQQKNLEERQNIIERLKNLYTNTEAGTNLFKAIREIKEAWKNAGQVAKSEFKLLNNNYFHHLNQFYQMLDMNKEYMEQEYAHNLEKRQHIIERAKELETEPAVQKALNELQYLHKLWKEEAEPVAEEFREKTWEEFKEISNRIHDRKAELSAQIDVEQQENLEKKNKIIEEIKKIASPEKEANHSYWQNAIRRIEELRSDFLKIGSVPRRVSNQNWNDFKLHLKNFNTAKNEFYKSLKNSQQANLEQKLKLIQTAKDNSTSEDWDVTVPLFKKLQEDWKKVGHVPKNMTNRVWDEFRDACNTFFNNYREKNNTSGDNWKENYKQKKQLLDELKEISNEEGSVERIEQIKNNWNSIGKVPREKLSINSEFNKTLREKLKLNKIHEYELKEEGLSENQLTDKARKIKNQIADIEAEIVKMENNLGFFTNPTRENPLLKETYEKIDEKKAQLESMRQSLHNILVGENQ